MSRASPDRFIAHGLQPPGINIQETDAPQMADMQRQTGCAWVFLFFFKSLG